MKYHEADTWTWILIVAMLGIALVVAVADARKFRQEAVALVLKPESIHGTVQVCTTTRVTEVTIVYQCVTRPATVEDIANGSTNQDSPPSTTTTPRARERTGS